MILVYTFRSSEEWSKIILKNFTTIGKLLFLLNTENDLPFFKTCSHVVTIFLWWCLLSRHHAERPWIDSCESFSAWSLRSNCSASKSFAIANVLSIDYQIADSNIASHCQHGPPRGTRATAFRCHRMCESRLE